MKTMTVLKVRLLILAVIWGLSINVSSIAQEWEKLGLEGRVSSIAFHPNNSEILYAVSDLELFKSNDGGATWDTLVPNYFNGVPGGQVSRVVHVAIDPKHPDTVYATATGFPDDSIAVRLRMGTIKTVNAGLNWVWADSGMSKSIDSPDGPVAIFIDPQLSDTLYLGTVWGLYKTGNGGRYWDNILTQNLISVLSVHPNNSDTVYVGTDRQIFKTEDGGENWQETNWQTLGGSLVWALAIDPYAPNHVFASGHEFGLRRSTNGGESWDLIGEGLPVKSGSTAVSIAFTQNELFVADSGFVYRSRKSPIEWTRMSTDTGLPAIGMVVVDPISDRLYVGSGLNAVLGPLGGKGLYRYDLVTAVEEKKESLVSGFKLYPNYPNPFNPETKIQYEVHYHSHVRLTIYNVLGKEVVKLINQNMMPGIHEVQWNEKNSEGNPVPSGVYFDQLQLGDYTRTRKMAFIQ